MVDGPIIFSAPMVRALLDGRKTQTRRLYKGRVEPQIGLPSEMQEDLELRGFDLCGNVWAKPRYTAGDRLWVRENVTAEERGSDCRDGVRYLSDGEWIGIENSVVAADRWIDLFNYRGVRGAAVPSIHMPRWASRLTLIVEAVKVERLQDISGEDARAEGAEWVNPPCSSVGMTSEDVETLGYQIGFWEIWCSIHGEDAWNKNQWVAAISFRVVKANIDALDLANRPLVCEGVTP